MGARPASAGAGVSVALNTDEPHRRLTLRIDEDTMLALQRLADAEDRTKAAQLRILIRAEAQKRGLWTPSRPRAVATTAR